MDQPGKVVSPARCQPNRETDFFSLFPFAPENLVSETGSAAPSRASSLILHTQAESDWLMVLLVEAPLYCCLSKATTAASTCSFRQLLLAFTHSNHVAYLVPNHLVPRRATFARQRMTSKKNSLQSVVFGFCLNLYPNDWFVCLVLKISVSRRVKPWNYWRDIFCQ